MQARIRARREQRRAAAIHDVYDHLYEGYVGGGYLRFTPGPTLQRVNDYDWNGGFTRYFNERLGVTLDGRGYYGTPFIVGLQSSGALPQPAISQYAGLVGPTYRFYMQPRLFRLGQGDGRLCATATFPAIPTDLATISVCIRTARPMPSVPAVRRIQCLP